MSETWPAVDRRNPDHPDRRDIPRGGRRLSDLPRPVTCPTCGASRGVRGLPQSRTVRWCHCPACGEVWPRTVDL
jgi:rubredoxin